MTTSPAVVPERRDFGRRIVITVVNQKGGSTKTTTTVGLAYGFVLLGYRVRVWDADPQGGSITHWLTPQLSVGEGLLEVYRGHHTVDEVTSTTTIQNLFIVPSWSSMREVENPDKPMPGAEMVLRTAVSESTAPIDIEIMDATHTMNPLSIGAVVAAEDLVIPLQPSELDLEGMAELISIITNVQRFYSPGPKIAAIVVGFANARAEYDVSIMDKFKEGYPDAIVTSVPMSVKMREAVAAHMPHQLYVKSKKNAVNVQFAALAESFIERWSR